MGDSLTGLSADSVGLNTVYSKYNANTIDTTEESTSYLDFSSYLELLVAQMSNQDMNNPMSDSEFLQQMASYSMLESINQMNTQSNVSYATSLVGKAVTVCENGVYDTGIVDSISVNNGKYYAIINGNTYETSSVCDVTDADIYSKLAEYIGKEVIVDDNGTDVQGKVTNVIVTSGKALAVLESGKAYGINNIKSVVSTDDSDEDDTTTDETEDSTTTDDTTAQTLTVSEEAANYQARATAISDSIWNSIDSMAKGEELSTESSGANLSFNGQNTVTYPTSTGGATLTVEQLDYASILNSQNDNLFDMDATTVPVADAMAGLTSEELLNLSNNSYNSLQVNKASNLVTDSSVPYTSNYSSDRKYADLYPEEAKLADDLNTRMVDIKFINNKDITKRIDTSQIIGRTESGKAFTEIGYSGKGRLGEIVTWADGTQRVEIINPDGKSGYFTTSGNLTLDQICDFNCAPGSLAGKLTPLEQAIRHYSREYTPDEQSAMASFKNYLDHITN